MIELNGQSVTDTELGYTVSIHTDGGFEIQIESDFSIRDHTREVVVTPGESGEDEYVKNFLSQRKVRRAGVSNSGELHIVFVDGGELRVDADDSYEAWTVAGVDGYKAVCMPGGEVAVWPASNNEKA